jgi:TPR repeat protein
VLGGFLWVSGLALAAQGALADIVSANDAYHRGDYDAAAKEYRRLAMAGDPVAQYNLGQAYKLGRGVPLDLNQALDWHKRAADHNPPLAEAQDAYGLLLFQTGKRQESIPYLQQSANRGDARAQYVLGTAYFNGDLVAKDNVRAYALMTRASASGNLPKASEALATMDNYIRLDERQRGLAMAREMELATQNQQLATLDAREGKAVQPNSTPLRTEEIPASTTPGVTFVSPPPAPVMSMPKLKPIHPVKPVKPVVVESKTVAPPPPIEAPERPTRLATGRWRVQLGAFGDQAKAQHYGEALLAREKALDELKFFLVNAGPVTRLQAGPLGSKAEAERLCALLKAHMQACLIVNP